jgi:RNA polymerase sigma factor (sigma-70 family)
MATHPTSQVIQQLRRMLLQDEAGLTDGQLLGCFIEGRDEAAFAALVKRHGPLVWGACRRLLSAHDAEDAFQATFLVLCCKAATIRRRESLSHWLYGVAHQTALQARRTAARRRAREKQVGDMPEPAAAEQDGGHDLRPELDQELSHLPDHYQVVLLLCDLEGKSRKEAAEQLGLPEGTVGSRLARARALLAKRLARHGLTVTGAALGTALSQVQASATVPASVLSTTIKAAAAIATGQATAEMISSTVAALTEGVMKAMLLTKLKQVLLVCLVVSLLTLGSVFGYRTFGGPRAGAVPKDANIDPPGDKKAAATDRFGDPLPPGALARLGTLRFRHGGGGAALAFSPDGKLLATGEERGVVCLWEVATGKKVRQMEATRYTPTRYASGKLAFSSNGKILTFLDFVDKEGGLIRRPTWGISQCDVKTGELVRRLGVTGKGSYAFAYSPDGKVLAVAEDRVEGHSQFKGSEVPPPQNREGDRVRLLEMASGKELKSIKVAGASVCALAFAPDGKSLFTGVFYWGLEKHERLHYVLVWDLTAKKMIRYFKVYFDDMEGEGFVLSPDGKILACPCQDWSETARLLDTVSGKDLRRFTGLKGIRRFAFSADGKRLVGEGYYLRGRDAIHFMQHWDVASGRVTWRVEGRGFGNAVFAPDGKTLAVADRQVHLLDAATGKEILSPWGKSPFFDTVALSPDGRLAATSSELDRVVRFWDPATGKEEHRFTGLPKGNNLAFSPSGKRLLINDWGKSVFLWDLAKANLLGQAQVDLPQWAGFSSDGTARVVGQEKNRLWIDAIPPGKERRYLDLPPRDEDERRSEVDQAILSPDAHELLTHQHNGTIALWSLATGKILHRIPGDVKEWPWIDKTPVAFSPDGKSFVFRRESRGVSLWEAVTGKERCRLRGAPKDTSTLAFSPDGLRVMLGDERGNLWLWDAVTGAEIWHGNGHPGIVEGLSFSAEGHRLASIGSEGTVLFWDVQRLAPAAKPIVRHLTEQERNRLWADLGDADAARVYRAVHALRQGDATVISWLAERVRPKPVPAEKIAHLVKALDSDDFAVRQDADRQLERLGAWAEPELRRHLQQKPSPELRRRAQALLRKLERRADEVGADELRTLRALEVLEGAGTAEARRTLEVMVRGIDSPRALREANLALQRLARR